MNYFSSKLQSPFYLHVDLRNPLSTVSACYRPVDAFICSMLLNVPSFHSMTTRFTLHISILTTVFMCLKDQIMIQKLARII